MSARDDILDKVRAGIGRKPGTDCGPRPVPAPIPARGQVEGEARLVLFTKQAEAVAATVVRIPDMAALPAAVSNYLAGQNLPAAIMATADTDFDTVPWNTQAMLEITRGTPGIADQVCLAQAAAGIAETGSLVMTANADNPHMASFVPETAVVVLRASRIEGTLDDAMARLRVTGDLPRAVSLISGPSRTGDIALKIELGAHGPRRVHIVIVDEPEAA